MTDQLFSLMAFGAACGAVVLAVGVIAMRRVAQAQTVAADRLVFERLWAQSPDACLVLKGDEVWRANEACMRLFGVQDAACLLGRPFMDALWFPAQQPCGRDSATLAKSMAVFLRSRCLPDAPDPADVGDLPLRAHGDGWALDWTHERPDGERFTAEWHFACMTTAHGVLCLATARDVTAEQEARQRLQADKEAAESLARARSEFLANLSHEVRTPMNVILGLSHLVLKTELNERQREYFGKIEKSSQHLLAVVNDILDFSKIEAGKLNVEHAHFELERLLDSVTNLIGDKAAAKFLTLSFDVARDVPIQLVGDALRLGQILINFANNAVKFTDAGGILIRVIKTDETPQDVQIRFEVSDTGLGIPSDALDTLFEGFQQVANPAHRKLGGSGLGLAIAKRLAEAMGGQVGVQSVEGKGSTFWCTIRLGKGRLPQRALVPSLDLRGLRVLVADDNETARTVLSEMLIQMSFDVDVVDSGPAAIAALQVASTGARPYALVFLDWRMPGMDGTETAMNIKALALNPRPHCIMVTGYGKEHVLKGAKLAHVDDLLIKPVDASVLFDTVVRVLSKEDRLLVASSSEPADDSLLAELKGARVLVVEDNEVNAYLTKTLLENAGFVVDVAENGAIGLAKVKDNWYDLVFMDMQMPVMDGITATQEIRRIDRLSRLPIVAITANTSEEDRMRCLAAGMNDFLPKPLAPKGLWRAMLQWVTPRVKSLASANHSVSRQSVMVGNTFAAEDVAQGGQDPSDATPPPDMSVVLDWLKRHLVHEDPAALDLLQEHQSLLEAQLGPHYATLLASVEVRAFNAARQQLATVLQVPAG